jgi:hypothetical protein
MGVLNPPTNAVEILPSTLSPVIHMEPVISALLGNLKLSQGDHINIIFT